MVPNIPPPPARPVSTSSRARPTALPDDVYVVTDGGKVEVRPVETGDWAGDDFLVLSGLRPGDRVVTSGAAKLQPGAPVKVAAATGD